MADPMRNLLQRARMASNSSSVFRLSYRVFCARWGCSRGASNAETRKRRPGLDGERGDKMAPKMFGEGRLSSVGVVLVESRPTILRCTCCGMGWQLLEGGKLHRGWWKCPAGCNGDIRNIDRPE